MLTETGVEENLQVKHKSAQPKNASLFDTRSLALAAILTLVYLLLSYFLIGFKTDQLVLAALFNTLFFASRATRRFITGFSVFIVYWIVFDYMKAFPNYHYNEVNIASLYQLEKSFFGLEWNQTIITPNEYFALHHNTFLDVLSGIFYLCWVPVPLAFAAVLFFRNRHLFFCFSLTFFLVNIIGFMGYYLYPAAPPWYVAQQGFQFVAATPGNTAGLGRFDAFFGVSIFRGLYAKSSNVFAAMPSLHAAYLLIVLFYGLRARMRGWNLLFALLALGIWFAAVYSGHHYILDVLAGIACAIAGFVLFDWWSKTKKGKAFLQLLVKATSR